MNKEMRRSFSVYLVLVFIFVGTVVFFKDNQGNKNEGLRRAKTTPIQQVVQRTLEIMGQGVEGAPSFGEGVALFRAAQDIKLQDTEIDALANLVLEDLARGGFLNGAGISVLDARAFLQSVRNYAQGLRRDQVKVGKLGPASVVKMLRFEEIKSLGKKLQQALDLYYQNALIWVPVPYFIDAATVEKFSQQIDIATIMAGLWATSPVSSQPMLRALAGGNTAIMAANTQMTVSIPGLMCASMAEGSPLEFESAMSEVNLQEQTLPPKIADGYTGKSAQEFAEAIRYYAFLLGYDLPYAIHADHTTVSKDTPEAIDYARRLNQAQLAAIYTSFAIDPSSIPAVREETQLKALNAMGVDELSGVAGIDTALAERLKTHGEFKKLKELPSIEGMDAAKINVLMDYAESKILTAVLNKMGYEELMMIPRMTGDLALRIVAHGEFRSLTELKDIDGLGDNDIITVEGMDTAALMFDYVRTYLDLKRIIEINHYLAQFIPTEFGLEVEVGHIGRVDPLTGETVMTTALEALVMIEALHKRGIKPDLLAVNNGTVHGIVFVGGKEVKTTVDVKRTDEIAAVLKPLGVAIAQHGTTGTPFEVIKDQLAGNMLKANVGTEWRRTALRNMPLDLFYRMVEWTVKQESEKNPDKFTGLDPVRNFTREEIMGLVPDSDCPYYALVMDPIKRSIAPFEEDIDNMNPQDLARVIQATYEMAVKYFDAFNAQGKIWDIIDYLGWGWQRP